MDGRPRIEGELALAYASSLTLLVLSLPVERRLGMYGRRPLYFSSFVFGRPQRMDGRPRIEGELALASSLPDTIYFFFSNQKKKQTKKKDWW